MKIILTLICLLFYVGSSWSDNVQDDYAVALMTDESDVIVTGAVKSMSGRLGVDSEGNQRIVTDVVITRNQNLKGSGSPNITLSVLGGAARVSGRILNYSANGAVMDLTVGRNAIWFLSDEDIAGTKSLPMNQVFQIESDDSIRGRNGMTQGSVRAIIAGR